MKTSLRVLSQATLLAAAGSLAAAGFTDLHPTTGANTQSSYAYGISANGLTTVGYTTIGATRAAYWVGGVRTDLTSLLSGGSYSIAYGAANGGNTIIGETNDSTGYLQAVRWVGGAISNLGDLSGGAGSVNSVARAITPDGSVIVGESNSMAFKWTAAGGPNGTMTLVHPALDIISFPTLISSAVGVSNDGMVIVGTLGSTLDSTFIVNNGTYTALSPIVGTYITATAVSGNGLITVGATDETGLMEAFKHTTLGGLVSLGNLGGGGSQFDDRANAINTDGSVIVGVSKDASGRPQAFKYQNGAMTGLGFLAPSLGSRTSYATGVSADGLVIVGYSKTDITGSIRDHAFVYANEVMLDADEWMRSINGANSVLAMSENLTRVVLDGAHHRPLMSYDAMGKAGQAWVTGDFASSSRQTDNHATTGEIGFSQTFGNVVAGLSVGTGAQNQDLIYGGASHVSGHYLLAEADIRLGDKESILSAVVMLGQWQSDTTRGYATGSGTAYSQGQTNLDTTAVRLRYDGPRLPLIGSFAAAPFASVTWTRTAADAYAETGGSFPAAFNAQTQTTTEGRLGLTTKFVLSPTTTCLLTAEWIHRFNGTTATLSGTDILHGALPFSAAGGASTRNQARVGIDIDQKIDSQTLLNFSVHAAGFGQSPDIQGAISLRRAF